MSTFRRTILVCDDHTFKGPCTSRFLGRPGEGAAATRKRAKAAGWYSFSLDAADGSARRVWTDWCPNCGVRLKTVRPVGK